MSPKPVESASSSESVGQLKGQVSYSLGAMAESEDNKKVEVEGTSGLARQDLQDESMARRKREWNRESVWLQQSPRKESSPTELRTAVRADPKAPKMVEVEV